MKFLPQSRGGRFALLGVLAGIAIGLFLWHRPDTELLANAFEAVAWSWLAMNADVSWAHSVRFFEFSSTKIVARRLAMCCARAGSPSV